MPKPDMKEALRDSEPGLFLTDLSALNKLYQAAKAVLEKPSAPPMHALKGVIEEAESGFLAQSGLLQRRRADLVLRQRIRR